MTQRRNSKSHGRKEVKSALSKNGRRPSDSAPSDPAPPDPGRSWLGLVLVLALLGLWSSMAVVYFDVVDYDRVLARASEFRLNFTNVLQGKLSAYDSDGDGDFDLDDAKVLLGLNKDGGGGEESAESSLEEVIGVLSDEGSDWLFGFFSFLFDLVTEAKSLPGDKEPITAEGAGGDTGQSERPEDSARTNGEAGEEKAD